MRLFEAREAYGRLDGAGSAEAVSRQRLRAFAARRRLAIREDALERLQFHRVVRRRPRAVKIDVADLARRQPGVGERRAHRAFRAAPFRIRSGGVVCIARLAYPGEQRARRGRLLLENEKRDCLAEIYAVAIVGERPAAPGRKRA